MLNQHLSSNILADAIYKLIHCSFILQHLMRLSLSLFCWNVMHLFRSNLMLEIPPIIGNFSCKHLQSLKPGIKADVH